MTHKYSAPMVDLRSDTVTQPTAAMRGVMAAAPVGDDVFGDDPSVNALQDKIAAMLGFEAALFMPTGTQSNLCGILAHCGRGDEYIVGQLAHTYRYEGGGAAVLGSVQPQPLAQDACGQMALADIAAASSLMIATLPARACCAWKTHGTVSACPWRIWRRRLPWRATRGWPATWTGHGFSMRRWIRHWLRDRRRHWG